MNPKSTSTYDVDNRYRFYRSLDSKQDISPNRRGVRPGVDNNSSKNFLRAYIAQLRDMNFPRQMID
tara:strand:+ start:1524 stop:1721 length:198 start_codon:yes stop_codon:yes gene_type:complete